MGGVGGWGGGGALFWNSRCCLSAWIAVFSLTPETEMRRSLVYQLTVN